MLVSCSEVFNTRPRVLHMAPKRSSKPTKTEEIQGKDGKIAKRERKCMTLEKCHMDKLRSGMSYAAYELNESSVRTVKKM